MYSKSNSKFDFIPKTTTVVFDHMSVCVVSVFIVI